MSVLGCHYGGTNTTAAKVPEDHDHESLCDMTYLILSRCVTINQIYPRRSSHVTTKRLVLVQQMYFLSYFIVFVFTLMHLSTFSYCCTVNRTILSVSSILCHINTVCEDLYSPFMYNLSA